MLVSQSQVEQGVELYVDGMNQTGVNRNPSAKQPTSDVTLPDRLSAYIQFLGLQGRPVLSTKRKIEASVPD